MVSSSSGRQNQPVHVSVSTVVGFTVIGSTAVGFTEVGFRLFGSTEVGFTLFGSAVDGFTVFGSAAVGSAVVSSTRRVILEKTQPVKWPTTGSNS